MHVMQNVCMHFVPSVIKNKFYALRILDLQILLWLRPDFKFS